MPIEGTRKPLCIDLFCGLGGWADGFLAEGYDVIGFDIERHDYGTGGYPGQLVLQDVRTLDGKQFKDATVIVASPPCQKYSYMAMPWSRGKAMAAEIQRSYEKWSELNFLFAECFRIAWEAEVPLIVENVRGAQQWVGPAKWAYSSFYLWGDVPALMPVTENYGLKNSRNRWSDGAGTLSATTSSHSKARKAASAHIAKIPFTLASHIARCFKPHVSTSIRARVSADAERGCSGE